MSNANIPIGTHVRSFDFEGRDDCYVVGVLCAYEEREGCQRYVITVYRDIFGGVEQYKRIGTLVYPPVNGTPTLFGGVTNFVEVFHE